MICAITGRTLPIVAASVVRIHPLDPSGYNDTELGDQGLKRSANGRYSIPMDNPWAEHAAFAEELFAKGFRNPATMNFVPNGWPMVEDAGELAMEEINLVKSGGNNTTGTESGNSAAPTAIWSLSNRKISVSSARRSKRFPVVNNGTTEVNRFA